MPRAVQAVLTAIIVAVVAGCAAIDTAPVAGIVSTPLAATSGQVDSAAAARVISQYRASRGLPPVTVDPRLMRIAADHALRMAAANNMAHVLPGQGSFRQRLVDGGFEASLAAENIGAGYDTLVEAMDGWRASLSHNQNLLRPGVSLIGIAVASAPGSKYGTYWSLVLAAPAMRTPSGPTPGPFRLFSR